METCVNKSEDSCESVALGIEPDMSLGDVCIACACYECDRCGETIDLD